MKELELNQSIINVYLEDFRQQFIDIFKSFTKDLKQESKDRKQVLKWLGELTSLSTSLVLFSLFLFGPSTRFFFPSLFPYFTLSLFLLSSYYSLSTGRRSA